MQSITFSSRISPRKVCHASTILIIIQYDRRLPRPSIVRPASPTSIPLGGHDRSDPPPRITKYLRQRLHRLNRMVRTIPKTRPPSPPLDPLPDRRTLLRRRPQTRHPRHRRTRPHHLRPILSPPSPQRRPRKGNTSSHRSRRWSSYPRSPHPSAKHPRNHVARKVPQTSEIDDPGDDSAGVTCKGGDATFGGGFDPEEEDGDV